MGARYGTIKDALTAALRRAADHNPLVEVAPCAVLWPDPTRQWEGLVPALRGDLRVIAYGSYARDREIGPAFWILYSLAEDEVAGDDGCPPVVYLPGTEMRCLTNVVHCPHHLQPLAGLQYRAVPWLQPDGREWTAPAFFRSRECGLGLELKPGTQTEEALLAALPRLLDIPVAQLEEQSPLRASDFEALIGPMPTTEEAELRALIAGSETEQVEFKATARWSTKGNVQDPRMEAAIVKEVGAFLNSQGGTLLIGVEDDGTIRGLEEDYAVTKVKRPDQSRADAYFLWLGDLLLGAFGKEFSSCLRVTPHKLEDKEIARVVVDPAPWPAFAGKEELFFARMGSSSVPLTPRQAAEYVRKRWG